MYREIGKHDTALARSCEIGVDFGRCSREVSKERKFGLDLVTNLVKEVVAVGAANFAAVFVFVVVVVVVVVVAAHVSR
jgi:hypothetical protein